MVNKQNKTATRRTGNPAGAAAGTEKGEQKQSAKQTSAPEGRKSGAGGANPDFLQETLF